jgi:hypothetical protein
MFGQLENFSIVDPGTLKNCIAVMEAMNEYVNLGFPPGHEISVVPDNAIAIVHRRGNHVLLQEEDLHR